MAVVAVVAVVVDVVVDPWLVGTGEEEPPPPPPPQDTRHRIATDDK